MLDDPALAGRFPELAAAQVLFEPPVEQFKPAQTTLDLFLYDVRENMELRGSEPVIERTNGRVSIRRAPLRVACTYLVTAWPVGGAETVLQEHRLLSQVLQLLSGNPTIPAAYLQGGLRQQEPPLPLMTAKPDGLKDPAEFWTALGNRLRPSLSLKVTISLDVDEPEPKTAPVATSTELRIGERTSPREGRLSEATREETFRVGGRVTDAAGKPVAGADVGLPELGLRTTTDADGLYTLGGIRAGTYTLRAVEGTRAANIGLTLPAPAGSDFNVVLTG